MNFKSEFRFKINLIIDLRLFLNQDHLICGHFRFYWSKIQPARKISKTILTYPFYLPYVRITGLIKAPNHPLLINPCSKESLRSFLYQFILS